MTRDGAESPITLDDVRGILRTILDPEMPINIVDLGIVSDVRVVEGRDAAAAQAVEIDITPTFVGCPALDVLRNDVIGKVRDLAVVDVRVRFVNDPPWSVDRISDAGREDLRRHGVTVPPRGARAGVRAAPELVPLTISGRDEIVACPYCGAAETRLESRFGPTRCRMIYYCDACRNQFEHMKPV